MKVLFGYDGSKCSEAVIDDLRRTGLGSDTEALVVSVGELWLPRPASFSIVNTEFADDAGIVVREAKDLAAAGRDKIASAFPTWNVRGEARAGSPAREILDLASEWQPDLIVVGSHGRTGLARVFFGSVSQKIATEASCSVRIARERAKKADSPVRIIVGVDGSHGADAAVRAVARRIWPKGSAAKLVTAIGPVSLDGHELSSELERIYGMHAPEFEKLWAAGLDTTSAIHAADPRELLIQQAESWDADCIFLGATGLLTLDRFLFGTVVAAVTARAHCSVEVVRERITTGP